MSEFHTRDGKVISTLAEMAAAINEMSDEDFMHHVSEENNDIANWVRDVHNNATLADALKKTTDKQATLSILQEIQDASVEQKPVEEKPAVAKVAESINEPAKFPQNDNYEQTHAMGKEDLSMNDTYKKKEEWEAAKEAAHPEEEVTNPAVHEEEKPIKENLDTATDQSKGEGSVPVQQESSANNLSAGNASAAEEKVVPSDLKVPIPGATLADRLIPGIIGLILGLAIGYFVTTFFL